MFFKETRCRLNLKVNRTGIFENTTNLIWLKTYNLIRRSEWRIKNTVGFSVWINLREDSENVLFIYTTPSTGKKKEII